MALDIHNGSSLILPDGWEEGQHATINEFFEKKVPIALNGKEIRDPGFTSKGCSASDCLEYAKFLMQGMPISLVNMQGQNSYTLICPGRDRIIQFRTAELNTKSIGKAKQIHGPLVTKPTRHYEFLLPVYTYNILPGQLHVWQKVPRDSFPLERERRTVIDLAKFIASTSHFLHSQEDCVDSSWTKTARVALQRLEKNSSLKQISPDTYAEVESLGAKLHLLDTLPAVLTHLDPGSQNLFVDKNTGSLTGVISFQDARMEAFGINICSIYEDYLGDLEISHWSPYNMPAGEKYPDLSVCEVLTKAFWDALWENTAPDLKRKDYEEAVGVALRVGIVQRYFVEGMLDEIDLKKAAHRLSLAYAEGILLHLRDTAQ